MKILRLLLVLVVVLGLTALLSFALPLPDFSPPPEPSPPPPVDTASAEMRIPPLDDTYRDAAAALRQRDCDEAVARLDPRAASDMPDSAFSRVVQGLYAHACEDVDRALELLTAEDDAEDPEPSLYRTPLEDWRLLILADVAAALGRHGLAARSWDQVPTDSPLIWQAFDAAAHHAWAIRDADRALIVIERARRRPVEGSAAEGIRLRLEALAWEIGTELERPDLRRDAARRLLIHAPERARELEVLDVFETATTSGKVAWAEILTPEQLVERAQVLLDEDLPAAAARTLLAIPEEQRTFDALLLAAEALTRDRRGREAQELLVDLDPVQAKNRAALEWTRAQAVKDMATAYRGRRNLPSDQRRNLRSAYRQKLLQVVRSGQQPWASDALRALFQERVDQDRFDDAVEALTALRRLDPENETGAEWLWRLGWEAFQSRNPSGAIGYWAELLSLYPDDRYGRAGRYWTGRAHEALGDVQRARQIYEDVAAVDTTDFYRRYALVRLGDAPEEAPPVARKPWPTDPLLERARALSDLGLEELAETELSALRHDAGNQAALALESLILARKGQPRPSIGLIRRAFPDLGSARQAAVPREAMELYYPLAYLDDVRASADGAGLPLPLVLGMIRQESGFDAQATSRVGAKGLMQLMPATGREVAQRLGLSFSQRRLGDPSFNTRLGTTYFRQVLSMFDGNVELALAGYNGGPYRIKRLWRQAGRRDEASFLEGLPVSESKIYVKRIVLLSDSYDRLYDLEG